MRRWTRKTKRREAFTASFETPKLPPGFSMGKDAKESEYDKDFHFKRNLENKYEGKSFEQVIPGKVISNKYGESYYIEDTCSTQFRTPSYEKSRQTIISNLKLVNGIGSVWEENLKKQGYLTIEDLTKNSRWREPAEEFLKIFEKGNIELLQNWMARFLPKSHPTVHYLAGLLKEEEFAILDIETLGLFGRAIILVGVAKPQKNTSSIEQYLLRDIPDEPSALWEFISHLEKNSALITFNGRTFDVPFIRERLNFYGMRGSLNNPHFDVLHFARRAWRQTLPDCSLDTIEKHIGIKRNLNVPSALVPDFYQTYLKTGNLGPLLAIVEHNKQDLITLSILFSKLYEVWNL